MTYELILPVMKEASLLAAQRIKEDFKAAVIARSDKGLRAGLPDFVTETDRAAEKLIQEQLSAAFPDIGFMGEECGHIGSQERYFLVDPLDGTSNFAAKRDYFAVSVAYVEDDDVKAGVIVDPIRRNVFSAIKGEGASVENAYTDIKGDRLQAIQVIPTKHMQLECELSFSKPEHFTLLAELLPHFSGMRKSGSVALDLAYLAMGRPIAIVADDLAPYDFAAGLLIAQEAGAPVCDLKEKPVSLNSQSLRSFKLL